MVKSLKILPYLLYIYIRDKKIWKNILKKQLRVFLKKYLK